MHQPIVVVGGNKKESQEVCSALESEHCLTITEESLTNLERNIHKRLRHVVILDLDTLSVDNRSIRDLRRRRPGVCIIGISSRSFHPELEEAMSSHIYACLTKPVDTEELIYWIRAICEDWTESRDLTDG